MIITDAVALAVIFGVLVIFHELGHFVFAKLTGIRVEEFAVGFGPRLARLFKLGDTEYTIHALPIGGFVKLTGMEPGDEKEIPHGFQAQAAWKRALVIFAGPLFSLILAVGAFLAVGVWWGFPVDQMQNRIALVYPQTEASHIDLRAGDKVLAIDNVKITDGRQMTDIIHKKPGEQLTITVERNGRVMTKPASPRWYISYLGAGWSFMEGNQASVEGVMDHSAASKAGIKEGDVLDSLNGRTIRSGAQMVDAIRSDGGGIKVVLKRNGNPVTLTAKPSMQWVEFAGVKWVFPGGYAGPEDDEISRGSPAGRAGVRMEDQLKTFGNAKIENGEELVGLLKSHQAGSAVKITVIRDDKTVKLTLRPTASDFSSVKSGDYESIGLLGFAPEPRLQKMGFRASIRKGLVDSWEKGATLVKTLFSPQIKEDIGGPVMIAKMTATTVARGPYWVITMAGGLSLSLGIINLIPIPIVDGGHLLILAIEALRRKRFSREFIQGWTLVGLAIIIAIFTLVFYSDISKILGGRVPQ